MPNIEQDKKFRDILHRAHAAAIVAQVGMAEGRGLDCGFAWVTIDGKSPLANYCRRQLKLEKDKQRQFLGYKGYPTGWQWWKPGGYAGQSIGIHEAGAQAFRQVLADFGYSSVLVGSRYD